MSGSSVNKLFIVYDSAHVEEARRAAVGGATVICFDFLAERGLKEHGVPFVPLSTVIDFQPAEEEWWHLSHDIPREWYRIPAMRFFEYHGIRLAEPSEPVLQEYCARLFYYVCVYKELKKKYHDARLSIPAPFVHEGQNASCLAHFMPWTIVDAARMVWFAVTPIGSRPPYKSYTFPPRHWKTRVLSLYNALIGLFALRRRFKIYTSGYWTYLETVVPLLADTEVMVYETKRFFEVPWRETFAHRMRFFRPADAPATSVQRRAAQLVEDFTKEWQVAREEVSAYLTCTKPELDWQPILPVFDYLITYAARVIADIDGLERIMRRERPDVVLTMASVGGPQHYFFTMAKVAKELGIPSLELQHAGATVDPRSVYCRIETDYLATYGINVIDWHEKIGTERSRMVAIGAPRFDRYANERGNATREGKQLLAKLGLDTTRPVLFAIVPFTDTLLTSFDSYQLVEFFKTIQAAQADTPGLQVVFKFRSNRHVGGMREYLAGLFRADYAIAGDEDFLALVAASDAAVCNNSTAIYQILLARKPLILYPWKRFDRFHARVYEQAAPLFYNDTQDATNAITRLFKDASYHEELMAHQKHFLERYSFDGKSSERVAKLLRELTEQNRG